MPEKEPQITVIGGGASSHRILSGLREQTNNLNAIVNMADDGGSSGVLREEFGVLPPGDVRQCLVALSDTYEARKTKFNSRHSFGPNQGHAWGNLFLSRIEVSTDSFSEAVDRASGFLEIRGKVIPATLDNVQLVEGSGIVGETNFGRTQLPRHAMPELKLEPLARLNPDAETAIREADLIVIAPGNLYQSIAPTLLVEGIGKALTDSDAPVAYVSNLVNKPNHTFEYAVHDYASELERFAGRAVLDYVLYNTDQPSKKLLEAYALENELPVTVDHSALGRATYKSIGGKFLSHSEELQDKHDVIPRSFIRHDEAAIATALMQLVSQE